MWRCHRVRDRIADGEELARFIAELDRRLRAHPGRAPWAAYLSYLRELLAAYVSRSEEIVLALRGLERFTALEAEVDFERFLDVVHRALETLRSEDVLDGRRGGALRDPGGDEYRGNAVARSVEREAQLAGRRVVVGRRDRSGRHVVVGSARCMKAPVVAPQPRTGWGPSYESRK